MTESITPLGHVRYLNGIAVIEPPPGGWPNTPTPEVELNEGPKMIFDRATDSSLEAISQFVVGKSRSDIGRLRDQKQTEVRLLAARIAERRGLPDGDNFPAKRDARRVGEIQREIAFLTSVFDRPVT
jgi:hypothetical protein